VQLEDKLIDGRDAAHEESQQREYVLSHGEGEEMLPAPMVEAVRDAALEVRGQLLGAIRMILDRQTLTIATLHLPQREARALEALQVATSGRSTSLHQFVYASDRRDLLERALAVLQPNLIHADDKTAQELQAQFADLSERVGELRAELTDLEDAQDELLESHQKEALETAQDEPGAKPTPKPAPKPSDPDAPRPATTLVGPEVAEPPRPATTLQGPGGPEVTEPPRPATTLTGPGDPEVAEPPRPATTLVGPELVEPPRPPTSLVGPELADEVAAPTTLTGPEGPGLPGLNDPSPEAAPPTSPGEEIAAPAKPWWRRPFG
jgi:hypothetical protein